MQIQFSSIVATEETKTNIQNNRDYTLNASINKTFKAPFNLIKDPLSAGLSFGGSFREYAGPNPTIDPDSTRNDYTIRFSPSLTIPAGETMAILLSAGFTRVDSNNQTLNMIISLLHLEYQNSSSLTLGRKMKWLITETISQENWFLY